MLLSPLPTKSPAPGTSTVTATGPPSTPICCAETPTQVCPWRTISSRSVWNSGSASRPPLTLSHSTSTTPLASAGSAGSRTTTRVRYAAFLPARNVQRPSPVSSPVGSYDAARPAATYSSST